MVYLNQSRKKVQYGLLITGTKNKRGTTQSFSKRLERQVTIEIVVFEEGVEVGGSTSSLMQANSSLLLGNHCFRGDSVT